MRKAAPISRLRWIFIASLCIALFVFTQPGFAQRGGARGGSGGAAHVSGTHAASRGSSRSFGGAVHSGGQAAYSGTVRSGYSGGASSSARFYGSSSTGNSSRTFSGNLAAPQASMSSPARAGYTARVFLPTEASRAQSSSRFIFESSQPTAMGSAIAGVQPFAARNYLWEEPPAPHLTFPAQQRVPRTAPPPPPQNPVYTPPRTAPPPRSAQIPQRPIFMPSPRPIAPMPAPIGGQHPIQLPQAPRPIQPQHPIFMPPRPVTPAPVMPVQPQSLRFPSPIPVPAHPRVFITPAPARPVSPVLPSRIRNQRAFLAPAPPFAHVVLPGVPRLRRKLGFGGVAPKGFTRSRVRARMIPFPCINTVTRCGLSSPTLSGGPFGSSVLVGAFPFNGFGFDGDFDFDDGFGFPPFGLTGCFLNGFGFTECIFPPATFFPAGFFPFGTFGPFTPFGFFNGFFPFGFFGNGFFYSPPEPPPPPPVNPTEANPPINLQNYSAEYLYMPAPVPPPVPYSEPQAETAQNPVVDLVLKDGTVFGVVAYWLENNRLNYITTYNIQSSIPLDQLDLQKTVDMNYKRGVPFSLTPAPPPNAEPQPQDSQEKPGSPPALHSGHVD